MKHPPQPVPPRPTPAERHAGPAPRQPAPRAPYGDTPAAEIVGLIQRAESSLREAQRAECRADAMRSIGEALVLLSGVAPRVWAISSRERL